MKEYQQEPHPMSKSMRHWFEKNGIYVRDRRWRRYGISASSRCDRFTRDCCDARRHFRVLPHLNRMSICDGYFDRWANSTAATVPMPRTEAEFSAALETLLAKSRERALRLLRLNGELS